METVLLLKTMGWIQSKFSANGMHFHQQKRILLPSLCSQLISPKLCFCGTGGLQEWHEGPIEGCQKEGGTGTNYTSPSLSGKFDPTQYLKSWTVPI